jgi:hypothetical protein
MKIETIITPKVNFAAQTIEIEEIDKASVWPRREVETRHARMVISLRDKAVRDALICLGWRPPAEPDAQHSSTPVDNDARLRVRAHDPGTSMAAAEKASKFAGSHTRRILDVCSPTKPQSTAEIADKSGLTVVQVARRTHELKRGGRLTVAQLEGEDMVVDGYRCWLLAPAGGQS